MLIHAVYLLNCASEDPEIREKSLASLIQSLRVGDAIGATGVVLHPGSAKGEDAGAAIARAGEVIVAALAESERCQLHLEDTAGAGGTLGRSFEELARLIDACGGDRPRSACAWTPVTCSPLAMTSAPPTVSPTRSTSAIAWSASTGSTRCT